ncbi:MAG: 16S rRNA (uracil(1498)-N(3))-methyltransferase [Polyangiaceae bacterium]|nr:16S rRNA (uracil(1498)-N(3))-methyltransferase [Polyangiaceae bacterium]
MKGPLRVPALRIQSGRTILDEDASRYVARVHRMREGDRLVLFDPDQALEADAEIVGVERSSVALVVGEVRAASLRPRRRVTLLQATCKSDKFDAIVRDATELGVSRVVPVFAERSVARPAGGRASRWRKIAIEAARQCGRGDAPAIASPMDLVEAVPMFASGEGVAGFVLDPQATESLGANLIDVGADVELAFVVGPEGGFTAAEIEACLSAGLSRVSLGPLTLRAETVCAAVLGAVFVLAR